MPNFYISKGPFVSLAHLNAFSSSRGKGQNISFSIEDIQYYVLFNIIAGPEAVLRQPLEDTKVFECPEVLEFNQVSSDELIVSGIYRMPIYRTFSYIE